ncbi:MAG: glycosyltransferase family 2 protein [Candidatus Omnitrophota bacterium]|jgi:GT2 family glycosyltransferase
MTGSPLPRVSVIVLNYNGFRHLKDCFSSLRKIDYPGDSVEYIMVDNGSTDDSVRYVAKEFPWVCVIKLDKNYGFSKGNNVGAQSAKYDHIVFLNNDTAVERNWLKALVSGMADSGCSIVNSKVLYFHNRCILNIGRGHLNRWGVGFCKGAGEDQSLYNERIYIHHATGCSMLLKKDDFMKIGGFDEDFFAYHEDIDFSWRAWICGYKIAYIPGSIVYHKSGGTAGAFSARKAYLITRNTLAYIVKNCESRYLFSMFFMNVSFDISTALFFLIPLKPLGLSYPESLKISIAIFKGILDFAASFPVFLKKRRDIQSRRVVSDKDLIGMGIIMPFGKSISCLVTNSFKTINCLIEAEKQDK